jgi:hypothetical protein
VNRKVFLGLFALLFSALACYSDSPLWPNELTPIPPTVTPLPTPLPDQTRFQYGDLAYVPASVTEAAFRLDLTRLPEPVKRDFSNTSPQACSQNTVVRILYSGIDPQGTIYQLVDCGGGVGWTPEERLLGPISLVTNDRVLTVEGGTDETGAFTIEVSDPPYREDDPFRQTATCPLDATVDIISMYGLSTGELYYKIRCDNPMNPIVPNIGWTTAAGLFGPVRFRNGETGIVPQEYETIELTSEAGGGDVVGTCESGDRVQISETPVQRLEDEFYYEIECAQETGWVEQSFLVGPVTVESGERVLVTVPGVSSSAEASVPAEQATPEIVDVADAAVVEESATAEVDAVPDNPISLSLTTDPGPLTAENIAGECPDASITTIEQLAGVEGILYALVTCNEVQGWMESASLYSPVPYEVGETVMLGEKALLGFGTRGIYLSVRLFDIEGSSGGKEVIAGECAFDFENRTPVEAELVDIGYYRSSTGDVVGVFYRATCLDRDGNQIEGWINQDRIGEDA